MKLTKKLEAEIRKLMKTYWDSYLAGDLKTWASFLPAGYRNIGTTEEEIWNSKKEIVNYTKSVIDQMVGMAEVRNKETQIIPMDPHIMVHELGDMYLSMETGWTFYAKLRLSTLLEKTGAGWKILHQHGSYPDSKTEEGQTFAFNKISKENLELKGAVRRRTIELEIKNRELEIETALERIRARSMVMHHTSELQAVIHTVHKELLHFNIAVNGGSFIAINSDIDTTLRCWGSGGTADTTEEVHLPLYKKPFLTNLINRIKKGPGLFTEYYTQKEKKEFFTFLFTHEPWLKLDARHKKDTLLSPGGYTRSCCVSEHTSIFIVNHLGETFSDADNDILKRFGKVFEQCYTRFLDLHKAEGQARVAQIEAALERVRSRSMAMHASNELADVAFTLYEELQKLDLKFGAATIIIMDRETGDTAHWVAGFSQRKYPECYTIKYFDHPCHKAQVSAWKNNEKQLVYSLSGKERISYTDYIFQHTAYKDFPESEKEWMRNTDPIFTLAYMKYGALMWAPNAATHEQLSILLRSAKVFEQTYTRFLDLQKAEAQAQEAKLEASLERVRSKAMAMHKTEDLNPAVSTIFEELQKLDLGMSRCGIGIINKEKKTANAWITTIADHGTTIQVSGQESMDLHPLLRDGFKAWLKQEDFSYVLKGDDMADYYRTSGMGNVRLPQSQLNLSATDLEEQYYHLAIFEAGGLFAFKETSFTEEAKTIMKRFAAVFSLTYKRFLDLQKAEAQAREAQIEAALERVRSRTMGMQHSNELKDAALLLFQQVHSFGVDQWACGYNIWDGDGKTCTAWMARQDALQPAFKTHPAFDPCFQEFYDAKQRGESFYVKDVGGDELKEHYKRLVSLPEFKSAPKEFFDEFIAPEFQIFHIVYFAQGYLMFITYKPVPEMWDIFKRFGKVFEQTYTRFLDLKKSEAQAVRAEQDLIEIKEARRKAEVAFAELQTTQTQLIQSEKMASLGELTAGIAHEILNPLNFVNNFSEVSKELLDDMREAIDKGHTEDAKEIMNDVIQNLEKINHHGKRADAIVKSMLQHSQSNTGKKEPTDINALCDEYLRLSYHGLRAKDKSFNATLKTDFDAPIRNINIIPQQIGRVVLNLINNAFYAVNEKKKTCKAELPENSGEVFPAGKIYEPTVSISTKKVGNKVEIRVTDNGSGIPQNMLDKIFQPFFTTKPTGQGTGLGLSLSYDIVTKGHGGELKVETKEGEGTTFIIILMVNNN